MEAGLREVVVSLRSTLLSSGRPLTLRQISSDYRQLEGREIPLFKYRNLRQFFENVPGFKIHETGGEILVSALLSDKSSNIAELVARSKPSKKRLPFRSPPKPRNFRPPPRLNVQVSKRLQRPVEAPPQQQPIFQLQNELKKLTVDENYKENKNRLLKYCSLKKITPPIIKTFDTGKKGRSQFDCTVKIDESTFKTYPNSLGSEEAAIEKACYEALAFLKNCENKSTPALQRTSSTIAFEKMVERILELVNLSPGGYIADKLPQFYLEKFKEKLPDDWLTFIEKSPLIKIDKIANGLTLILPNTQQSSTGDLPALKYPEDAQWNVFIMSTNTTTEIWLRIIGEQYSDAFEALNMDMEKHFAKCNPSINVIVGQWYAVKCEDGFLRAKVLETDPSKKLALCVLPDTGDKEHHPFSNCYELPNEFLKLPAQAILCQLSELEEYNVESFSDILSEMIFGKVLIADIADENASPMAIYLFDTSTDEDININKELLKRMGDKLQSPKLTQGISEIHICNVRADCTIDAQVHDDNWNMLEMLIDRITSKLIPIEAALASIDEINFKRKYLVKSASNDWMRAYLKIGNKLNEVSANFIDFNKSEKVPLNNVYQLDKLSMILSVLPPQILKLSLHKMPTLSIEQLDSLNKLIHVNTSVLCKQVSPLSNAVELFVRTQPANLLCNINDAIKMEIEFAKNSIKLPSEEIVKKKDFITMRKKSGALPSVILPEKKSPFDIHVIMAANPSNFMVRAVSEWENFSTLLTSMQHVIKKSKLTSPPKNDAVYAATFEKPDNWERVVIQTVISGDTVSAYFCDRGHFQLVNCSNLRMLPAELMEVAPQAIRAKLYGISPVNGDWAVEDCVKFKEMVINKKFKSVVEGIEDDAEKRSKLLVLNLLDVSNNGLGISDILLKEGRARKSF